MAGIHQGTIKHIGHRGAAGHEPENTLRSFRRAMEMGVHYIELDVQRTRDGHLVILHDKRVDRTTNGSGYIADMSLAEARKLDAGLGEKIPLLSEVLELTLGKTGLMLEMITPGIAAQVAGQVGKVNAANIIFASFLHGELSVIRQLIPYAFTLALIEAIPVQPTAFARDAGVTHVGLSIDSLTAGFVAQLQQSGYRVFVYTVNDPRDIAWMKKLAVDGIITNYPERLCDATGT